MLRESVACRLKKNLAGLRQFDMAPASRQQLHAKIPFQLLDRLRQRLAAQLCSRRSCIVFDSYAPNSKVLAAAGGLRRTELWETTPNPASNAGNADAAAETSSLEPKTGGSIFRVVEYPPDKIRLKTIDPTAHFGSAADQRGIHHPGMHKTRTIDYAIVLSGEIYAVLETSEVLLRAGDCLIQRGTNHAWSNRADAPCQIAFVMISAETT